MAAVEIRAGRKARREARMKMSAVLAAVLLSATGAAAQDASQAWNLGALNALHLASAIKATASQVLRGSGDISGQANMFPCPIGPFGNSNGIVSGSADVSGNVAVQSADGEAHGVVYVSGVVWLNGFCSNGMIDMVSGMGPISGFATIYGTDGKSLGVVEFSGEAMVSGGGFGNVEGTVNLEGSL